MDITSLSPYVYTSLNILKLYQIILTKDRIVGRASPKNPFQRVIWSLPNTWLLEPTRLHIPNSILMDWAIWAGLAQLVVVPSRETTDRQTERETDTQTMEYR